MGLPRLQLTVLTTAAKRLAASPFVRDQSERRCEHCDNGTSLYPGKKHKPDCPTQALPEIVRALAAAPTERTPDGHPQVWLLYRPEPFAPDAPEEQEISLWVRRADVFTSRDAATAFLSGLLGRAVGFDPYGPIFPELWVYRERRGAAVYRWLMAPAPVDPPSGREG